ncbi:MAG: hypothetical protein M3P08_14875 [Thermoproteota archaeon]|nr:hypothetical protein [Thermoproteota archaeon]
MSFDECQVLRPHLLEAVFICCANAPGASAAIPIGTVATRLKGAIRIEMLHVYTTTSLVE